jgi:hypothetical protein
LRDRNSAIRGINQFLSSINAKFAKQKMSENNEGRKSYRKPKRIKFTKMQMPAMQAG